MELYKTRPKTVWAIQIRSGNRTEVEQFLSRFDVKLLGVANDAVYTVPTKTGDCWAMTDDYLIYENLNDGFVVVMPPGEFITRYEKKQLGL